MFASAPSSVVGRRNPTEFVWLYMLEQQAEFLAASTDRTHLKRHRWLCNSVDVNFEWCTDDEWGVRNRHTPAGGFATEQEGAPARKMAGSKRAVTQADPSQNSKTG